MAAFGAPAARGLLASPLRARLTPAASSVARRCLPAPAPDAARRYTLVSPDGKSAEKRLRSLLVRCPEWGTKERLRLAAELEAEEEAAAGGAGGASGGVPELLRSRTSSNMRKGTMLGLAFRWRYKSDCWRARPNAAGGAADGGAGGRKRARHSSAKNDSTNGASNDTPPTLPQCSGALQLMVRRRFAAPPPLYDRTYTTVHAAHSQVLELMSPHIAAAAAALAGPASYAAYSRVGGRGLTWLRVRTLDGALEVTEWLSAVCTLRLRALREWHEALGEDGRRTPAYMDGSSYNSPECELEAMRQVLCQARASTEEAAARQVLPDGTLAEPDAAWVYDYREGNTAALALVASGAAFVARQRMEPLHTFIAAAEAVLMGMCRYMSDSSRALQHRLEWTSATCVALGAAAGDRQVAQSTVPPLVRRMRLLDDDATGAGLLALARTPPPSGEAPPRFVVLPAAPSR